MQPHSFRFALLVALLAPAGPRTALACGASAGGASGIDGCNLSEHEEAARRRWRLGAGFTYTSTGLSFGGGLHVDEVRESSLVTLQYRPLPRLTLEAGAGVFLGGSITTSSVRYPMAPGFAGAVGASWRLVDASGAVPFVLLTAQLAYDSSGAPQGVAYHAFDLRVGAAVGTSLWSVLTPYAVGRAFGGPTYWSYQGASVVGTDDHHWQLGAGLSLLLAHRVDVFVEGIPLGELGVTAGAGLLF